ncbi:restriction endonuclease subunit S [Vibrio sp. 10N.247.310.56]|uniref:restriction endonuclease subunit S n=1 Tax=unclassified Vibrio TaxID=2614977 RepID=UPI00352C11A1
MQKKLTKLEKDLGIEWQEFKLEELFGKSTRGRRLKSSDRIRGKLPFVTAGEANMGISAYIGNDVTIFPKNTITIDMFGSAKYRNYSYGADDHVAVVSTSDLPESAVLFITSAIHKSANAGQFDYSRNFYASDADELTIQLPVNDEKMLAIDYMEQFIGTLKAERVATLKAERVATLKAYLKVTGLEDYHLTSEEQELLDNLENLESKYGIDWKEYRLDELFGKASRGRRLKSADRINGDLPFVTAGEVSMGISAYIGNDVKRFSSNTITIDMFGSSKYRSYEYGADDHVAVIHSDSFPELVVLFATTAIHKSSHAGQFDYSRNFYASDADELLIQLPTINSDKLAMDFMSLYISIVKKLVIKDVVLFSDREIELTDSLSASK